MLFGEINRRELLGLAAALPLLKELRWQEVKTAPWKFVPAADGAGAKQIDLIREWDGPLCRSRVVNRGKEAVAIREVVLFDIPLSLPSETRLYGEGFQMLSQSGGTL